VGRRRWLELAEAYRNAPSGSANLMKILSADRSSIAGSREKSLSADRDFQSPSDRRFQIALDAVRASAPRRPSSASTLWTAHDGKPFGALKMTADAITLTLDLKRQPQIADRALELLAALKEELARSLPESNRKG